MLICGIESLSERTDCLQQKNIRSLLLENVCNFYSKHRPLLLVCLFGHMFDVVPLKSEQTLPLLPFGVNSSERAGKSKNPHRVLSNNSDV